MQKLIFFILAILVFTSCSKTTNKPAVNEDNITLSTQILGSTVYYVYGYSFEKSEFIRASFPNPSPDLDIIPTNITDVEGNVTGARLTSIGPTPYYGIHKEGSFSTLQEATDFYNAYKEVTDTSFTSLSDSLAAFQVYTFKTTSDHYVKFMITAVNIVDGTNLQDSHAEIDLKYYIQRDGSKIFSR